MSGRGPSSVQTTRSTQVQQQRSSENQQEVSSKVGDDLSHDSDSEAEEDENAQPPDFFDPDADVKDAAWADEQRHGRQTDAILSCPCCLATCCIDCQQHDVHPGQYRAMFVTNCRVDLDAPEFVPAEMPKSKKRGRTEGSLAARQQAMPQNQDDIFHPVCCSLCGTKLGLCDSDEVFHFTSVLASEA